MVGRSTRSMHDDTQPQILSPEDSALWRQAYLDAFADTSSEHYRRYIAFPRQFSDGVHYEGSGIVYAYRHASLFSGFAMRLFGIQRFLSWPMTTHEIGFPAHHSGP